MFSTTVTRQPALARLGDPTTAGRGYMRDALKDAGAALTTDLRARSADHPGIAAGWRTYVQDQGATLALVLRNDHPGVRFLDQGAHWPGKMPNITAMGDYLESKGGTRRGAWIAARLLQIKGMPAHYWTRDALEAIRPQIVNVPRAAIQRFLKGL